MFGIDREVNSISSQIVASLYLCSQARFWLLKKVPEELLGSATAAIRPNFSFLQRSR